MENVIEVSKSTYDSKGFVEFRIVETGTSSD